VRTTIDLPVDVLRQAKAKAALDGLTLKDLITRFVVQGLEQRTSGEDGTDDDATLPRPHRHDPPVTIPARGRQMPALSNAELQALLDAEDAERATNAGRQID
jgi:hypothetical protein